MENEELKDPTILNHPYFEDEKRASFLKHLIEEYSDDKLESFERQAIASLTKHIFQEKQPLELKKDLEDLNITFFTTCGKLIPDGSYFYRCLDCDKYRGIESTIITIMCKECYEKSNHEGHRVFNIQKENNSTATCDCGDIACLEESGFCSNHKYTKINPEEMISRFPESLRENFLKEYKRFYYSVISIFEQLEIIPLEKKLSLLKIAFVMLSFTQLFDQCMLINRAFILLISKLFRSKLNDSENIVWHDCENFEELVINKEKPHPCKCNILELLFRFMKNIPKELQSKYTDIFTELHRDDEFKICLNETFCKCLNFLVPKIINKVENNKKMAYFDVFRMSAQIFGTEALCLHSIQNNSFNNFYGMMRKILDRAVYPARIVIEQFDEIAHMTFYFFHGHNKEAGMALIEKLNHFKEAFELLMNSNIKFAYQGKIGIGTKLPQINFEFINDILIMSRSIELLVEKAYRISQFIPEEKINNFVEVIVKSWHEFYSIFQSITECELKTNPDLLFYPCFERIFTFLMIPYVRPLSANNLKEAIRKCLQFDDNSKIEEFSKEIVSKSLPNFGIFRYLQLVHSFDSGPIHKVYLFINNLIHEHDIISMQMMALLQSPNSIFDNYVKGYFSFSDEIRDFILDGKPLLEDDYLKQKHNLIEDFFFFLNHIMTDELCYLSAQLGKKNEKVIEEPAFHQLNNRVMRKLLINLMSAFYWTNLGVLKNNLKNIIKDYKDVDEIIFEISEIDASNMKLRLKEQYLQEFDPYFFYKTKAFQQDIINSYEKRTEKTIQKDIISGVFYKDLPQYLYQIQVNFFSSSLLDSIKRIILNMKETPVIYYGPVIRLIYFNLELIHSTNDPEIKKSLISKFIQTFENKDFILKLCFCLNQPAFKDYHACIKKIFHTMNFFSSEFESLFPSELKTEHQENDIEKQERVKQRMKEIQLEYLKKQQTFAKKHLKDTFEITQNTEEKQNSCQYCLDNLENGKAYGLPVFIDYTNNFYSSKMSEQNPKPNQTRFLCMKSCGHWYHQECYQVLYEKTWDQTNLKKNQSIYWNYFEHPCPICKMLTNNFLSVSSNKSQEIHSIISEESKIENTQKTEHKSLELHNSQAPLQPNENQEGREDYNHTPEPQNKPTNQIDVGEEKLKFDFIEKIIKLYIFSMKKDPFDTIKPLTKSEIQELPQITESALVYFLESTYLIYKKNEVEQRFMIMFYFFKEYFQKVEDYNLFQKNADIENNSLDEMKDCFKGMKQNINNFTEILHKNLVNFCCKLITSNPNDVDAKIKIYLQNLITMHQVCLSKTIMAKDSEGFLKEKIYESIQKPIQYLAYTRLFLLSRTQNIIWKEVESKFRLLTNQEFEEEKYLNEILKIFEDDNLNLHVILNSEESNLLKEQNRKLLENNISGEEEQMVNPDVLAARIQGSNFCSRFIELPLNFQEFNAMYLTSKCSLCKEHRTQNVICLCLICGQTICRRKCNEERPEIGNLSSHAYKEHAGATAFFNTNEQVIYLISFPKIAIYPVSIYIDKFGINVNDLLKESRKTLYSLDFKNITLNKLEIEKLKEIICSGYGISQNVYTIISHNQLMIKPAFY